MRNYKGMNFQEWCLLDEEDERKINYILIYVEDSKPVIKNFTSENEVSRTMLQTVRNATIHDLRLINNEWHVILDCLEEV